MPRPASRTPPSTRRGSAVASRLRQPHREPRGLPHFPPGSMRLATILTWLAGIGLLALLLASNDVGALLEAVWQLHWWLVIIVAYHAAPLLCDVLGWRLLFQRPPPLADLLRM